MAVASLTRGTEKRAEVQRRVLEATERLLAAGASYTELNVERIAREAGISRTAFYFYFSDKRELLMRLTEHVSAQLYAEAEAWWTGDEDLRPALTRVVALYRDHAALLRAVVEAAAYDEPVASFWRAIVGRFAEATRARLQAEQAAGRLDAELPAEETAFQLCWMTERACYQRLVQGGDPAGEEFLTALAGLWERGVYGRLGPPAG